MRAPVLLVLVALACIPAIARAQARGAAAPAPVAAQAITPATLRPTATMAPAVSRPAPTPAPVTLGPLPPARRQDDAALRAPELPETRVELQETLRPSVPLKSECGESVIGQVLPAPAVVTAIARWTASLSGRTSRLRLHSAGAQGLRFAVDRDRLPADVELRVYAPDGTERYGPYRPGADGKRGEWWSPVISGEALGIEFHSDARSAEGSPVPDVTKIAYMYDFNVQELGCHNDIGCRPEWADASYAVAKMVFNCSATQCTVCSGSLLNRPANDHPTLFLTASHCISTDAAASTLTTIFFFQNRACDSIPMTPRQVLGSELLEQRRVYDVTLLGLSQAPPAGVTYLDYDITNPFPYGSFVGCIHHPGGTTKRYTAGGLTGSGTHNFDEIPIQDISTWDVTFDDGAIEKGSSGSPLLDSARHVHGVLTGGPVPATCAPDDAYFGRFDLAYETLSPFLGNIPNPVWCNPAASGEQAGTVLFPFATIERANNFCVAPGGTLRLTGGYYHENPTFTKPMTIETWNGGVTIGTP